MTIEVTKVWVENDKMFALQIPEAEIYKREWVGLTDEEIWKVSYDFTESEGFRQGAYWAQNRLEELNT